MREHEAIRRLVKSPPELWEQCSDAQLLARHLNGFGEITITQLDPENTVAWEGESASGTVTLEASGWGTRVRLTATPPTPLRQGTAATAISAPLAVVTQPELAPRGITALISSILGRRRAEVTTVAAAGEPDAAEASVSTAVTESTGPADLAAELEAALDSLGQAHRRPYSRS